MQNTHTLSGSPKAAPSNTPCYRLTKLGDVAAFPFLEMPDSRYINDGFQVLLELGAVEAV